MSSATAERKAMNTNQGHDPNNDLLCAVLDEGAIALVRLNGRGCFANSMGLKDFSTRLQERNRALTFIIDLANCESMDSTFMGVMAGIAITQIRNKAPKAIVLNANDHCIRLLKNLGVGQLVDIRRGSSEEVSRAEDQFRPTQNRELGRTEQICLTLQAHKQLVNLDKQNEVRFQAVIEYLEKSLTEEDGGPSNGG